MKKFNWLMVCSFLLYIGLAFTSAYVLTQESDSSKAYMVDVNRIQANIKNKQDVELLDVTQYPTLSSVFFLDEQTASPLEVESFYREDQDTAIIQPWYEEGTRIGTLKFTYIAQTMHIQDKIWFVECALFLLEVMCVLILWYFKLHVVKPFEQLSALPQEFAQGNYKHDVLVQKGHYLNPFIRGMAQLRDHLEVSKKRQLELEKEKKQTLLSLSHDIKTPLHMIKLYGKALEDNIYEEAEARSQAAHQICSKCSEIEAYVQTIMKQSREDILDIQVKVNELYVSDVIERIKRIYVEQCAMRHVDLRIHTFEDRMIKGDINRIQEVFENLFENAFKYGDGRFIELSFYEEDYCQLIQFYNSGKQVQEQERNHLFDSFYRGANAEGIQGNGLGLYICKTIMRKMDGDIFMKPEDSGMSFVLVFR